MRLSDKRAIVTGAGSGFGRAIAEAFAEEGATVAILDIDDRAAREVADAIGPAALPVRCDVSSGADVDRAVAVVLNAFHSVDILVNNAGVSHPNRDLLDVTEAEFDRVFATNVKSIFLMARAVLPAMLEMPGAVVINIGSTGAIRPRPGLTWYNGSKGAVHVLTKSMALELAPRRIRVVAIAPVAGATSLLPTFLGVDSPERRLALVSTIPLGRLCQPADVAKAAVFLASSDADFLTGVVLEVDGGRCA